MGGIDEHKWEGLTNKWEINYFFLLGVWYNSPISASGVKNEQRTNCESKCFSGSKLSLKC